MEGGVVRGELSDHPHAGKPLHPAVPDARGYGEVYSGRVAVARPEGRLDQEGMGELDTGQNGPEEADVEEGVGKGYQVADRRHDVSHSKSHSRQHSIHSVVVFIKYIVITGFNHPTEYRVFIGSQRGKGK